MITKFDRSMFRAAVREAKLSDFKHHHVGCVVVYKKHIISSGHNSDKTHPSQKHYNQFRSFNTVEGGYVKHSVHAEIDALSTIPYCIGKQIDQNDDWDKVKIYVVRPTKSGLRCAKPCDGCMAMIRDYGIRHVYYSDDEGLGYLHVE